MRTPAAVAFRTRNFFGLAAAAVLPLAATIALAVAQEPASAAELSSGDSFKEAFSDIGLPEGISAPTPAEMLEAATSDAAGQSFDEDSEAQILGTGTASYYGAAFAGHLTANGERFDPDELTAAHPSLPFGSLVRVTNQRNGKSVVVRINDRGPFHSNRLIDLSRSAAEEIGIVRQGKGQVKLALLTG
jgi:rare lipoprotein A